MVYRYWCGECGYRTPWLDESRAEELQIEHYARRHPDVPPGGTVEVSRRDPDRAPGCLSALGVLLLLVLFASACGR